MEKLFIYFSFVMATFFVIMAVGLFFLPSGIFEDWSPLQRYTLGTLVLAYAGFRIWRARKMLLKQNQKTENPESGIEKDE